MDLPSTSRQVLNKIAGQGCGVLRCARHPAKSLLTWFLPLEDRREGKQLPYSGFNVCPDKTCQNKPAFFGRWFQLNGGPCGLGVRAHNLGKPNRLGACMIDSKGNVRPEGMFNRVRLAPEARSAYDTQGVVVGDVPNDHSGNADVLAQTAKARQSEQGALKQGGIDLLVMPPKLKGRLPLWRACSVNWLRGLAKPRN